MPVSKPAPWFEPEGWNHPHKHALCRDCVLFDPCPTPECRLGVCKAGLGETPPEIWWAHSGDLWCGDDDLFEEVPRNER